MTEIVMRSEVQREFAMSLIRQLDVGKTWQITVKPFKKKRSLHQNALYWKWLGIIAVETGNDPDDLHEIFKQQFLIPVEVEFAGEVTSLRRSTTKLNTQDMSAYMDKVNAFAASQLGIILPLPDDQ